jgi:hypothetical protein
MGIATNLEEVDIGYSPVVDLSPLAIRAPQLGVDS